MKKKLQLKKDLKFLTDALIMAIVNVMLIVWQPFIEIPLVIGLIVLSIIQHISIKNYEENFDEVLPTESL